MCCTSLVGKKYLTNIEIVNMNIAEILRKLADIADSGAGDNNQEPQNVARLSTASAGLPIDNPENQDAGEGDPVMVPRII